LARPLRAAVAAALLAGSAAAGEPPKLKVFGDTPSEKGQWRFEITKGAGGGAAMAGHAMTFCMDAAQQMAEEARKSGDRQPGCSFKVLEDTATRATFETACSSATTRGTIQRDGPKTFLFSMTSSAKDGLAMEGRYTYVGPCSKDSAVVGFDRGGKECQQARAQLAALDSVKLCGSLAGEAKKTCEEGIASSRKQITTLCP
jgi:hypothetical protein